MKAKGILKNVGGNFLMQAVNIITNLILPPLLIRAYGSQMNGLISTVTQIISYISLVGAGLSISTTQALYKPLAEKDNQTISGMLNATGKMFNRVGLIFCIIASVISLIYPIIIHQTDMEYAYMVVLMLIMSVSGATEFFATGRYRSLLYADRKIYVYSLIQSFCLVLSTILAVICIKMNLNILYTQAMISLVYVLRAFGLTIYVKKKYTYIDKSEKPINKCVDKRKDAMYHQLIGLVVTGSQSILLSVFVGLEAASIYAVYNVVFSGLQSICVQMSNAVVPFLGKIYVLKGEDLIKKYDAFELIFFVFITIIFSIAFVMIKPFVLVYTAGADINYIDHLLIIMFVIRGYANTVRLPAQGMINAAGFFAETKKAATIEALLCIFVEIFAGLIWGIYGIMAGSLVSSIWRGFEMILYTNKIIIKRNSKYSIYRTFLNILCIMISYAISLYIIPINNIDGYLKWGIYACISGIVSIVIITISMLITERKNIKIIMKEVI